jgi:HSP20 family protein
MMGARRITDLVSKFHRMEGVYGPFRRTFLRPTLIDAEKAAATYTAGLLDLSLPKADNAKPKAIKITAEVFTSLLAIGE